MSDKIISLHGVIIIEAERSTMLSKQKFCHQFFDFKISLENFYFLLQKYN